MYHRGNACGRASSRITLLCSYDVVRRVRTIVRGDTRLAGLEICVAIVWFRLDRGAHRATIRAARAPRCRARSHKPVDPCFQTIDRTACETLITSRVRVSIRRPDRARCRGWLPSLRCDIMFELPDLAVGTQRGALSASWQIHRARSLNHAPRRRAAVRRRRPRCGQSHCAAERMLSS